MDCLGSIEEVLEDLRLAVLIVAYCWSPGANPARDGLYFYALWLLRWRENCPPCFLQMRGELLPFEKMSGSELILILVPAIIKK